MHLQTNEVGFWNELLTATSSAVKEGSIADSLIKAGTAVVNAKTAAGVEKAKAKAAKYQAMTNATTGGRGYDVPTYTGGGGGGGAMPQEPPFELSSLLGGKTGMVMLGGAGAVWLLYAVLKSNKGGKR